MALRQSELDGRGEAGMEEGWPFVGLGIPRADRGDWGETAGLDDGAEGSIRGERASRATV